MSHSELPEEAVEAALSTWIESSNRDQCSPATWTAVAMQDMRAALTAALPHLPAYTVERELREALEPFAAIADHVAKHHPGWDHDGFEIHWPHSAISLKMAAFRRARAALSRAPAPERTVGVKVKPLEWQKRHGENLSRADTIVGAYRVWTHHEANGKWFYSLRNEAAGAIIELYEFSDEASAKAAAQQDYNSRILSALEMHDAD